MHIEARVLSSFALCSSEFLPCVLCPLSLFSFPQLAAPWRASTTQKSSSTSRELASTPKDRKVSSFCQFRNLAGRRLFQSRAGRSTPPSRPRHRGGIVSDWRGGPAHARKTRTRRGCVGLARLPRCSSLPTSLGSKMYQIYCQFRSAELVSHPAHPRFASYWLGTTVSVW